MLSRSIGFQTKVPKISREEEETTIPIKLTSEKPRGMVISCGKIAALGVVAREAKSGALLKVRRISS
jgi:hypothetical protein